MAVTKIDHIELIVNRFEEYVALFRALGFQERLRDRRTVHIEEWPLHPGAAVVDHTRHQPFPRAGFTQ